MVYTYTRTYTKQELEIRSLKNAIYNRIKNAFEGNSDESYLKVDSNGEVLNERPMNLYEAAILTGPDFTIKKLQGAPFHGFEDLFFEYQDGKGSIISDSEDYSSVRVILGDLNVSLLDFADHPEVEEYISEVTNKINNQQLESSTPAL